MTELLTFRNIILAQIRKTIDQDIAPGAITDGSKTLFVMESGTPKLIESYNELLMLVDQKIIEYYRVEE